MTILTNVDKLPINLCTDALFCCWRYEDRDGKQTKVPYNPVTGKRARSNDSETFASFPAAVTASANYNGLGVGIFNGICGIDIDHCIDETGYLSVAAADIVETMASYTERSPSGTGIHILFKAENFTYDNAIYYINNQKNGIEAYVWGATNKYLTLTGDALFEGRGIEERSAALSVILDKYMRRKESRQPEPSADEPKALIISDDAIIQKASKAKNSDKFNRLWNGDITGYKSQSEADQALCNILAFYARGEAVTVDHLFRQSALYRPKWDEVHGASTYGAATINKACEGKIIAELKAQAELINRPYVYSEGNKNKIQASLLAEYIRTDMKYFFARSGASGVLRYIYEDGVYRMVPDDIIKGFIKKYIPLELQSTKIVNEVFGQLITDPERYKSIDLLNADESIINFKNGIFHLDTGNLTDHSPDILSTIQIPCNYNANAEAPQNSNFNKYMLHLCESDPERVTLLLEFAGLSLSNVAGYRSKKCLVLYGAGNSGKSVYREVIYRLLGHENCSSIDLATLEKRFGTSCIYGKRIAGAADMSFISVDELNTFKNLTGGDDIFSEFKGKDGFQAKYRGVLLFCANDLPRFGGDRGDHVYERFMLLPCNEIVAEKDRDPRLIEKLFAEREYIVSLAVKHLKTFIDRGYRFTVPECCIKAISQYKVDNDNVMRFIAECTEPRSGSIIRTNDGATAPNIYRAYLTFCEDNGEKFKESRANFDKVLEREGLGAKRLSSGYKYYSNLTLTNAARNAFYIGDLSR